jgi:hypothetical protein
MIDIRPTRITVINRTGVDLANEQDEPDWREIQHEDYDPAYNFIRSLMYVLAIEFAAVLFCAAVFITTWIWRK